MEDPLEELYLSWLYDQVWDARRRDPAKTYWSLIRQLFKTEFVWIVPNDDNRIEDGCDLRREFLADSGAGEASPEWMDIACSFLEMLLGLSRRLAFEAEGEPRGWFWHMIENLELADCTDANYDEDHVSEVTAEVIWRTYHYNGTGGLFPLERPAQDQRDVEIWYQFNAYLLEREEVR